MFMQRVTGWIALGVLVVAATATDTRAADHDAEAAADFIGPYIEQTTVLVVQGDLEAMGDMAASLETTAEQLDAALQAEHPVFAALLQQHATVAAHLELLREAGARRIYVLVDLSDVGRRIPFRVIIPKTDGANADRLRRLLLSAPADGPAEPQEAEADARAAEATVAEFDDAVVRARPSVIERLRRREGRMPRGFAEAMRSVEGHPLKAVIAPPSDVQRVLSETRLNNLPTEERFELPLDRMFSWAAAGLRLPPDAALAINVAAADAEGAAELQRLIRLGLAQIGEQVTEDVPAAADAFDTFVGTLTFERADDRLTLTLADDEIVNAVADGAAPWLAVAREEAMRNVSMSNLRQIVTALHSWLGEHKQWPDDLGQLATSRFVPPEATLRPEDREALPEDFHTRPAEERRAWINQNSAYVLLGEPLEDGEDVLAFEKTPRVAGDRHLVGRLEGSVATMTDDELAEALQRLTGRTMEQLIEWQARQPEGEGEGEPGGDR